VHAPIHTAVTANLEQLSDGMITNAANDACDSPRAALIARMRSELGRVREACARPTACARQEHQSRAPRAAARACALASAVHAYRVQGAMCTCAPCRTLYCTAARLCETPARATIVGARERERAAVTRMQTLRVCPISRDLSVFR